ncbi:hypothetical protein [Mycoplasmopsis felis]|uniref:hypothetical protein n=1 Tax=Mycoplasmopsis felis TaxID=33923 RepID=UPI000563E2DB|nr:hypothetical protein [Mycoplasmopsis felis]
MGSQTFNLFIFSNFWYKYFLCVSKWLIAIFKDIAEIVTPNEIKPTTGKNKLKNEEKIDITEVLIKAIFSDLIITSTLLISLLINSFISSFSLIFSWSSKSFTKILFELCCSSSTAIE